MLPAICYYSINCIVNQANWTASRQKHLQLGVDNAPIPAFARPFFVMSIMAKLQHFQEVVTGREHRFCLGNLTQLAVESLNGVDGINQRPNLLRRLKIRG